MTGNESVEGGFKGQTGIVRKQERFLCKGAARRGKVSIGLGGTEVDVNGLPGKEEEICEHGRDETEEKIGGREAGHRRESW